jgi:hypothetical protein
MLDTSATHCTLDATLCFSKQDVQGELCSLNTAETFKLYEYVFYCIVVRDKRVPVMTAVRILRLWLEGRPSGVDGSWEYLCIE